MSIKAIQTEYRGYRFRSRLEARWAVYFDSMGVKWYYEHEGYELSTGWYLPDFYLPNMKLHVEVKPDGICEHAKTFRDNIGAIAITCGMPGEPLSLYCWDYTDSSGGSSDWQDCQFGVDSGNQFCLFVNCGRRDRDFLATKIEFTDKIRRGVPVKTRRSEVAIANSRSARFERK